jgi:hypothetical protein
MRDLVTLKRANNKACKDYVVSHPWPGDENIEHSYVHNYGLPWYISYIKLEVNDEV